MITLKKACLSDCHTIRQMAKIAFPATYAQILSNEQLTYMMEWMYSLPNLHKQITEDGHLYYIAWENDTIPVGYVSIQQEKEDLFHLQKIYILPGHQGKGIGRLLFKQAIHAIHLLHPSPCTMELNVNRHNQALHFYEKMGMRKVREGDFPIGNGYYMNDYIMAMRLFEED